MKKPIAAIAAAAIASLALTGCMKEEADLSISKKQTLTGEISQVVDNEFIDLVKAYDDETPGAASMSRAEYLEAAASADAPQLPKGVTYKIVSGKKYSGVKFIFTKASFKAANKAGKQLGTTKKPLFSIKSTKKKQISFSYRLEGTGDLEADYGQLENTAAPKYKISVKFPGKVIKTNGKLKKRTVTWKGTHPVKTKKLTATSKRK